MLQRLVRGPRGPGSPSEARHRSQPDPSASRSKLVVVPLSTTAPARVPMPPVASLPGPQWTQTFVGSSLRRRMQSFSARAAWPECGGLAAEPAGQQQCGARRPLARSTLVRAAMCSTICCCLMLTSVRCFNISSMAGEELPPIKRNKRKKRDGRP